MTFKTTIILLMASVAILPLQAQTLGTRQKEKKSSYFQQVAKKYIDTLSVLYQKDSTIVSVDNTPGDP